MSNSLAIAAVTTTLRNLLDQGVREELGGGVVTANPPDKARQSREGRNQLNIFLYQTIVNGAWRNMDMPNRVKPGEIGQPPLALNLYYLITAYAKDNDDVIGHRLLGAAMQIFHDRALLNPEEIKRALPESNLHNQIERVRITPQQLSLEELSKLWSIFQTQYRISAAYEVSVILIDSKRPVKAALPVLTRGEGDRGIETQADVRSPFPTLTSLEFPNRQSSLRLGERLMLQGERLEGANAVILRNSRLTQPLTLAPAQQANQLEIELPNQPETLPAGFYTATVQVQKEGKTRYSNALSFSVAPLISSRNVVNRQLILSCVPDIWAEQAVILLIGDRELLPEPFSARTNQLAFDIREIPNGDYFLRLRIDGVDSLLVDRSVTPPIFDPNQKITL
jgi:Pvc16 N-terminal domain